MFVRGLTPIGRAPPAPHSSRRRAPGSHPTAIGGVGAHTGHRDSTREHAVTVSSTILTTRNATLNDLTELLNKQHTARLDVVTSASRLSSTGGNLRLLGAGEPRISSDGVTLDEV